MAFLPLFTGICHLAHVLTVPPTKACLLCATPAGMDLYIIQAMPVDTYRVQSPGFPKIVYWKQWSHMQSSHFMECICQMYNGLYRVTPKVFCEGTQQQQQFPYCEHGESRRRLWVSCPWCDRCWCPAHPQTAHHPRASAVFLRLMEVAPLTGLHGLKLPSSQLKYEINPV